MNTANIILAQLGGLGRISAMIGAKNFVSYSAAADSEYGESEGGVAFKFPMRGAGKPNHVKVILEADDTYTVTFTQIRGLKFKTTSETALVYAGDLARLFENTTGLRLSL